MVYTKKIHKDNALNKYKARIVARDMFREIDFNDTFSPTAHPVSVRALVSLAIIKGWILKTSDVKTAYLNAVLANAVYMHPPKGLGRGKKLLRLKKCLYGLKISAKRWHETVVAKVKAFGMTAVTSDDCVWTITRGNSVLHIVIVVDDFLQATNDESLRQEFIAHLRTDYT
eukprot:3116368-Rhodomonas_salina.1